MQVDALKVKIVISTNQNQENLQSIQPIFFRQAHGIVYVYDPSDKKSFTGIQKVITKVKEHTQDKKCILIANSSSDPKAGRAISEEEGRSKARDLKIDEYFETNAQTGENVIPSIGKLAE